jgi:hypothetical protein
VNFTGITGTSGSAQFNNLIFQWGLNSCVTTGNTIHYDPAFPHNVFVVFAQGEGDSSYVTATVGGTTTFAAYSGTGTVSFYWLAIGC